MKLSKMTSINKDSIVYYSAEKRYNLFPLLTEMVKAAGDKGWVYGKDVMPKSSWELADKEVQEYIKE